MVSQGDEWSPLPWERIRQKLTSFIQDCTFSRHKNRLVHITVKSSCNHKTLKLPHPTLVCSRGLYLSLIPVGLSPDWQIMVFL